MGVRFIKRTLPEFEAPREVPPLDPPIFESRYRRLEDAREAAGLDCLAIYADREHSANLAWLSGFDPRFEEALWIQGRSRTPTLLVGNENVGYAPSALKLPAEVRLYQPFSLPNQDRSKSADLATLLRSAGVTAAPAPGWPAGSRSRSRKCRTGSCAPSPKSPETSPLTSRGC